MTKVSLDTAAHYAWGDGCDGWPLHELTSGEGIEVPPGVPHQIRHTSAGPLEFLVVSHPHSHGDREPA